jgi:hypothetical protein
LRESRPGAQAPGRVMFMLATSAGLLGTGTILDGG